MPDTPTYGLPYQAGTHEPDGATLGRRLALGVEGELSRIDSSIAAGQTDLGDVENDIADYITNRPVFRAYIGANKSISSGAEDGPGTMTVDVTVGGAWDSASHSSIRVFPVSGYYLCNFVARWDGTTSASAFQVTIRKNSTAALDPTTGDLIGTGISASGSDGRDRTTIATTVHHFAAGENVQMGLIQNSGSSVAVVGGNIYSTYMEMFFIRPS